MPTFQPGMAHWFYRERMVAMWVRIFNKATGDNVHREWFNNAVDGERFAKRWCAQDDGCDWEFE